MAHEDDVVGCDGLWRARFCAGPPLIGFLGENGTALRGLICGAVLLRFAVVIAAALRPPVGSVEEQSRKDPSGPGAAWPPGVYGEFSPIAHGRAGIRSAQQGPGPDRGRVRL